MASCADCDITLEAGSGGLYTLTRCITDPLPDDDHLSTLEFVSIEIIDWTGPSTPTTDWLSAVVVSAGWVEMTTAFGTHDHYQLCLSITIDADQALADNGEGTYTIRMIGRRAGTTDNVNCDWTLCIVTTQAFVTMLVVGTNSLLNQVAGARYPLGVGLDNLGDHFWQELRNFSNDGGYDDNDGTDITGGRFYPGDADLGINPFLLLQNEQAGGTVRFFTASLRHKEIVTPLFSTTSFGYPGDRAYDIIGDARRIAFIERQSGSTNDYMLKTCAFDGTDPETVWYPGPNDDTAPAYDVVFNTLNGFLYFFDAAERLHRIRPDATGHSQILSTTATGGTFRQAKFVPGYGTQGGLLTYCNPGSGVGWHIFDCATETFADVVAQFTSDDLNDVWVNEEKIITLGGAIAGNPARNQIRVTDYEGNDPVSGIENVPGVHTPLALVVSSQIAPFLPHEVKPGFSMCIFPDIENSIAAPDNVREVYANDAGTVPTAIDGEVAHLVDQGRLRKTRYLQATASQRPLLKSEGGYKYLQFDKSQQQYMTLSSWNPVADHKWEGDQMSQYFVIRDDGWATGVGSVFLEYQSSGTNRFMFGTSAADQFFFWWGTQPGGRLDVDLPGDYAGKVHLIELHTNASTDLMEIICDGVTLGSKTRAGADLGNAGTTLQVGRAASGTYASLSWWFWDHNSRCHNEGRRVEMRTYLQQRFAGLTTGGYFD